jgi:NADH:ubiquinone oxidoreductase subunit 5 (subunit L)/multisubunit Na+/H+ antiporter MnhA subunit
VGLITALAGGVVAGVQPHAKRVLAGSTSAQYGLMFVGVGAGSTAAAGAHLVAHALFKSLLFLGAGVAIHAAGSSRLADMRLGTALRGVAVLSGVGAVALAAVPPLGGAWSKEQIAAAAVHASGWLGAGIFAAALLSAAYAARYQLLAYGPSPADRELGHVPGRVELIALAALAAVTVVLSLLWLPAAGQLTEAATLGALVEPAPWELPVGLAVIAAGFAAVWWLWQRGRLATLGLPLRAQAVMADWLGLPAAAQLLVVNPVLALSAALARFDDRVIDAGVRGVVAGARLLSRLASLRGEWTFDGAVRGLAGAVMAAAAGSRAADDRGIDAAVEQAAAGVGAVGGRSRQLQTGLSHHYYVIIGAGVLAGVVVLALLR